ncbi:glycosyltransferase [Pleurocapsa sp. PCC 7319]|uniref:glycosyltransferase n=1 Tax=Pleurocapsa sp. PCC 7319 TaxID=118161 RepID=UPI00036C59CC|nr:glycosyltransferase [Pleurocapsa sp. PCC 7319]
MEINRSKVLVPEPQGSLVIPKLPSRGQIAVYNPVYFSLVIPTYQESKNIAQIIRLIGKLLDEILPDNYELIVVDDNSPDRTWKKAQSLVAEYSQLQVMRRQRERGLATAVIRGWQVARGEILGVIDGDLQHPPEILLNLLQTLEQGADLVIASRHIDRGGVSDWSIVRRFLSRGAQILGLIMLPEVVARVSDPMSGYFVLHRRAIAGHKLNPVGYKILIEVLGRGNIDKISEVGYVFQERQQGETKVAPKQYVQYLQHLLRLSLARGRISRLKKYIQFPASRFIRFCLVGLSGVFVDMTIFYLLSDPTSLGWGLTRSKIMAAELAIINNFCWNDRWTFGDIANLQPGWGMRWKRLLKFNLICLGGLILNVLLLNLLFNLLDINRYLANLTAIAAVTIWNFWLNYKLSWRVTKVKCSERL